MGTVTRDERKEALEVYAACVRLLSKTKRKHMRAPLWVIHAVQDAINKHWAALKEAERLTVLYLIAERYKLDTKYTGPLWKLAMSVFWLKDKTTDMAANFILHSDKRLN